MEKKTSPLSQAPKHGKKIDVTVTYLEQSERPVTPTPRKPLYKTALLRVENPQLHYYRYIYCLVGEPYHWFSRLKMKDAELEAIIRDDKTYIYILYVNGAPGGFAEIDAREENTHHLRFFGLAPDFIGKGLGRFFLTNVIDLAWSHGPRKIRLETCTLDHPAALPLYQKMGFRVIDRRQSVIEIPTPISIVPKSSS